MNIYHLLKSLRSVVDGDKVVTPMEYTELIYYISSVHNIPEECLNELRNMRCILNRKGNYIYPHQALMGKMTSFDDDRFLDETLNTNAYTTRYCSDPDIKSLLAKIGVVEILSGTTDDITYTILVDNYAHAVRLVDSELRELNSINIAAHLPRQHPYHCSGEISLVFYPLQDSFNFSHSETLAGAQLSIGYSDMDKWFAVLDINTGQIIIPFKSEPILDTKNDRIIYGNSIYSTNGEKLFPNEDYPYDDLVIIERSRAGIYIATDLNHNYFIVKKDLAVAPLDNKIYLYDPTYSRGGMTFEILENGMITAVETFKDSWGYSIIPELTHTTLLDSNGKFILSSDIITYDRINNHIITKNNDGKGIRRIYDKDVNYLYSIHNHRCLMSDEFYSPFRRIETEYDGCRYFGIIEIGESDDMRGPTEKLIFPPICEEIVLLYKDGPFKIKLNGKYGLLQHSGNMTTPICFDHIGEFVNGVAEARIGNNTILIDLLGGKV